MNIEPEEIGPEVPEADALEQRTPVAPESAEDFAVSGLSPDDVSQPDFIEQHTPVQPGGAGYDEIAATDAEAAEADLIEQATESAADSEDDYSDAREDEGS